MWVSPFRHPRIDRYLPLPAAFRSLSRLSSAPSAKASALCPFCLTCPCALYWHIALCRALRMVSHAFSCLFISRIVFDVFLLRSYFLEVCLYGFFKVQPHTYAVRRPPALPCRPQHSTIGRPGLNHRVRDGYGCVPWAHRHRKLCALREVLSTSCGHTTAFPLKAPLPIPWQLNSGITLYSFP